MHVIRTKNGLRLSQHGVVISELRTSPGPTHSVFDLLAALVVWFEPRGRAGMLGFAGGGMMAPLQALGWSSVIEAVDLDRASYDLFRQHCPEWVPRVRWQQAEAGQWLRRNRCRFALLLEDLSIPTNGDVVKPGLCWEELPALIHRRLAPGGVALFNLLSPPSGRWSRDLPRIVKCFPAARIVSLDEFENRLLIAGEALPSSAAISRGLQGLLRGIGSRQADRFGVRTWR